MTSTITDRLNGLTTSVAVKAPCRVATTANITLSGEQTIDGVAVVADDRVLVKDQTTAAENGIYVASASAWTRAPDFDGSFDAVKGTTVYVHSGTNSAETTWRVSTADGFDIGTDSVNFEISTSGLTVGEFVTVDTVADMTALLKANLTTGDVVFPLGYSAAGDRGGGLFQWDEASAVADDGGTVLASDEGGAGRWLRMMIVPHTSAEMYGEAGDDLYTGDGRLAFGVGALEDMAQSYDTGSGGTVIALGYNAMANMTAVKKSIAIGTSAQANGTISRDNIAIGDSALKNVQAVTADYSQSDRDGTRNVAIGGNAGYFMTSSWNNVAIGRNAGQNWTVDTDAVAVGGNACAGYSPIGLSGEIENWAPTVLGVDSDRNDTVAIGGQALSYGISSFAVAIGGRALRNCKKSLANLAVGCLALEMLDSGTWVNGGEYTDIDPDITGTYSQSGTTLTLNITAHTLSVGDIALFRLTTGGAATFADDIVPAIVATAPSADQITITSPVSQTASGVAILYAKATAAQQDLNEFNTVVGSFGGSEMLTGVENTFVGYRAAADVTDADYSAAVGYRALSSSTGAQQCTAIGWQSLRTLVSGSLASGTATNQSGLGYNTRVSGDNQVQLGNSATTTYAFGAVQDRSDLRDKADVRDTVLGLDFILALRPVDFRRDYRDDYIDTSADEPVFRERDGSSKRNRFHHGLIAQEVEAVLEKLGVDFGGYQDHTINGGCDVKTIGYTELIGPLIKAVHELAARMQELEAK